MAGRAGKEVYRSPRWRAVRQKVFARDNWKCVECGKRGPLECDHIRPVTTSALWYDEDNLRTLCRGCHIDITREQNRKEVSPERQALIDLAMEV